MTPTEKQERILSLTKQQEALINIIVRLSKLSPAKDAKNAIVRAAKIVAYAQEIFKLDVEKYKLNSIPNFIKGANNVPCSLKSVNCEGEEIIINPKRKVK